MNRDPILWVRGDQYHIRSTCGHYTVAKAGPDFWRTYTAWYRKEPGNKWSRAELLDVYRNEDDEKVAAQQAKDRCQRHADSLLLAAQQASGEDAA